METWEPAEVDAVLLSLRAEYLQQQQQHGTSVDFEPGFAGVAAYQAEQRRRNVPTNGRWLAVQLEAGLAAMVPPPHDALRRALQSRLGMLRTMAGDVSAGAVRVAAA